MILSITLGLLTCALRAAIPAMAVDATVSVPTIIVAAVAIYLVYLVKEGYLHRRRRAHH